MKNGNFEQEASSPLVPERELEEILICPNNVDIYNVKRVLYCPGRSLKNSDLIRGRRLEASDIAKTMELIGMAGFGLVTKTSSTSNRNKGVS